MNLFQKHGKRIEKLYIDDVIIHISHILKILKLMPNLVELKCCNFYAKKEQVLPDELPNPSLVLQKLTKLSIWNSEQTIQDFLTSISCPVLHTFQSDDDEDFGFMQAHKHVEHIKLDMGTYFGSSYFDGVIEHRHLFNLHKILLVEILNYRYRYRYRYPEKYVWLINSQPQLKLLRIECFLRTELLQSIVELRHLESLEIWIGRSSNLSKQLVCEMMQMPRLKSLVVRYPTKHFIESMLSDSNERLQSLVIGNIRLRDAEISRIAESLPNLEHLTLEVFKTEVKLDVSFLSSLRKLKSVRLADIQHVGNLPIGVNESVRNLSISADLNELIRVMPNTERLKIAYFELPPQGSNNIEEQLLKEMFSLSNLMEVECDLRNLKKKNVAAALKNLPEKLQQITFMPFRSRKQLSEGRKFIRKFLDDQFPFNRVDFDSGKITVSRF